MQYVCACFIKKFDWCNTAVFTVLQLMFLWVFFGCVHTYSSVLLVLLVRTKKENDIFSPVHLAFTPLLLTPNLNTQNDKCDVLRQNLSNIQKMMRPGLNAPAVCLYIWWYFCKLRSQKELTKLCKRVKTAEEYPVTHTNEDLQQGDAVLMPVPVMGNTAPDEKKTGVSAFCPF